MLWEEKFLIIRLPVQCTTIVTAVCFYTHASKMKVLWWGTCSSAHCLHNCVSKYRFVKSFETLYFIMDLKYIYRLMFVFEEFDMYHSRVSSWKRDTKQVHSCTLKCLNQFTDFDYNWTWSVMLESLKYQHNATGIT